MSTAKTWIEMVMDRRSIGMSEFDSPEAMLRKRKRLDALTSYCVCKFNQNWALLLFEPPPNEFGANEDIFN
jgi:hypothetical protein